VILRARRERLTHPSGVRHHRLLMKRQSSAVLVVLSTALALVGCSDEKPEASQGGATGAGGEPTNGSPAGGASSGAGGLEGRAGASSGAAGAAPPSAGGGGANGGASSGGSGTAGLTGEGDFPPLDLADDARTLSEADKGLLCDWVNETLGGYGLATDCGPIMRSNDRDQALCVQTRFKYNCKVTVQEVKDCTLATAPSHACNTDFQECHPLRCIE
jgi:hypothetical protein